jgi:teichoic acid transport system permease protein
VASALRNRSVAGPAGRGEVLLPLGVLDPPSSYLARMWRYRDFIRYAGLSRLRAEHQSMVLGGAWNLLNPLLQAAVYFLVFGVIFAARDAVANYAAFLVIGVFVFLYTARAVQSGGKSLTSSAALVTQINFPRAALPLASSVREAAAFVSAVVVLLIFVPVTGEPLAWSWWLLVPLLILQTLFNVGLALIFARLSFQFRDIDNLLPHALRLWMYVSGVFFGTAMVTSHLGVGNPLVALFELNPTHVFISVARGLLMESMHVTAAGWLLAVAWALVSMGFGFWFFRRRELDYGS